MSTSRRRRYASAFDAFDAFVARPALVQDLAAQPETGLTVLAAPAGYGKTWLARQVAGTWGTETLNWTIQSTATPIHAARSFCTLLGRRRISPSLEPDAITEAVAAAIMAKGSATRSLVIDVDGAPPSAAMRAVIARVLLDYVTRNRVLVACRNPWILPIDRIAAYSPVKVFKAEDLALSAEELGATHNINPEDLRNWVDVTEGWPAICGNPDGWCEAASHTDSSDDLIDHAVNLTADYLEHVLLAAMAPRDIRLLMHVSILSVVEPGVLGALEQGNAWARLESLVAAGLPVSHSRSDWDRIVLHPVFGRFLERRMAARAPAQCRALHRSVAEYFVAAGNHGDALRHAAQAGDPAFETQVTEQCGGWHITWREGLRVLGTGNTAPLRLSERFPKAALARIYWLIQTGRVDDAQRALEQMRERGLCEALSADLQTIDCILSVYRDAPFSERQLQRLASLRPDPNEDEPLLFPGSATVQAAALNNAGLYHRGAAIAQPAIAESEACGSSYVAFYGHLHYAAALHGLGRVVEAIPEYLCAQTLAGDVFGPRSSEYRMVSLLAAHANWLIGNDHEAEMLAGHLEGLWRLHAWFEPYARMLQIAVAISRKRGDRALEDRLLEDFSHLAERRSLPRLQIVVQLLRAQQTLSDGQIESAREGCETAMQAAAGMLPERNSTAASVLAPVSLELARIALARGAFEDAAQALDQVRGWSELLQDGAVRLEALLLEAYVALRARRYRDVSQTLAQCLAYAERTGLRRPFLNNAAFAIELVEYARGHALNIDAGVLHRIATMARPGDAVDDVGKIVAPTGHLLLTDRETDVLHLLSEGLSSKEMARRLEIAEGTIKTHRRNLYEKLGCGQRTRALSRARELGLL